MAESIIDGSYAYYYDLIKMTKVLKFQLGFNPNVIKMMYKQRRTLIIALDTSGSMSGAVLEQTIKGIKNIIKELLTSFNFILILEGSF